MAASKLNAKSTDTIFVTGCSGFIGSAIIRQLSGDGYTNQLVGISRQSSRQLIDELGISVLNHDLTSDSLLQHPYIPSIHTLIHCASPNDIASTATDGGFDLAVSGTYRLIESAIRKGLKRVIYLSTLQVYGTELNGSINEESPHHCETPYALNHFFGEEVCRLAHQRYGIDVVVLRPSNVYGIPSISTIKRSTLVPMCFIRDAVNIGALELRSSGKQVRNFVSLEELTLQTSSLFSRFPSGYTVLNTVSSLYLPIIEVAKMVAIAWKDCYGHTLPISTRSQSPLECSGFSVTSRFPDHQLSHPAALERFSQAITQLVQLPHLIREPNQ